MKDQITTNEKNKAALDAATKLASDHELGAESAAMLAMEAVRVRDVISKLGKQVEMRSKLLNSEAIDRVTQEYWQLMLDESNKLHEQAILEGRTANKPLPSGTVTRAGYEAVHIHINKTVSCRWAWIHP